MPDTPGLTEPSPAQGGVQRELDPHEAAERAMQSEHQAFAGSAEGVGSVEFDDAGAYEIGAEGERKDREAEAPGAWRDDPADPSERSRETTPAALRMPPD